MGDNKEQDSTGVTTLSKPKVKEPSFYQVLLLNDDYTTMDFVIHVLQKFFQKTGEDAQKVMMKVHTEGKGVCGVYPHGIAETKVMQVNDYARKSEYPLKCIMEKV